MKILRYLGVSLLVLIVAAGIFFYKNSIPAGIIDANYTNRSSQFLILENGSRIHYRDAGNRLGEPLVLLHGSNASLHTWEPWVELLREEFRVITLDLPGHGLTGAVPNEDYSNHAFVETVDAVITQLGLVQFTLGGNSMGGGVTWRYTLRYPEKVRAMVLIAASGLPEWRAESNKVRPAAERETPIFFDLLAKPWFRAISTKMDTYYFIRQTVLLAYNHSPVVTDELIMRYYELSLREGTREATKKRFADFAANKESTFELSGITQPTLILWGDQDALISPLVAEKFASVLPNSTLLIFPDVGHVPMEEIPAESAAAVSVFMQTLNSESRSAPDTEPEAGTDTESEPGTNPESEPGVDSEPKPEADPESESATEYGSDSAAEGKSRPVAKSAAEPDLDAEAKPDIEYDFDIEFEPAPQLTPEPEPEFDFGSDLQPVSETEVAPDPEPVSEPHSGAGLNPESEADLDYPMVWVNHHDNYRE